MSKAKKNTVRVRTSDVKKAMVQAARYNENRVNETEYKYRPFEDAINEIQKYLNKDGTVSKTKTRTKKAKAALNAAAAKALQIGSSKKKRDQNSYNKRVAGAAQGLSNKVFDGNTEKSSVAAQIFMDRTRAKLKKHVDSDIIITLTDAGFTLDEAMDIINSIEHDINFDTPKELKSISKEDDISVFVDNIVNLRELYPDMTISDAVEISDYMTGYRFNNYEEIAGEWGYE